MCNSDVILVQDICNVLYYLHTNSYSQNCKGKKYDCGVQKIKEVK